MPEAAKIVETLALQPHPEGGWYRETLRVPGDGGRAQVTAILYLLERGQHSHWHRVDATEIWCWHAGAPLLLKRAETGAGPTEEALLGPDVAGGESPQAHVPAGHWQAADARKGWALVSCIVSPGFEFSGFEMAAPGWNPAG